jgi:hypothetical protein
MVLRPPAITTASTNPNARLMPRADLMGLIFGLSIDLLNCSNRLVQLALGLNLVVPGEAADCVL